MLHDSYTEFALGRITSYRESVSLLEYAGMAYKLGWCEVFVMVIDKNFDMRFAHEVEIENGRPNCGKKRKVIKLPDTGEMMMIPDRIA